MNQKKRSVLSKFLLNSLTILPVLLLFPQPVFAHAFGAQYNLSIPREFYLYGSGTVVALSFILAIFYTKHFDPEKPYSKNDISKTFFAKAILSKKFIFGSRLFSIIFLGLLILVGFTGSQTPSQNLTPNFFWMIFLLGFTYLTALFGNFFKTISYKKSFFNYPVYLSYYPAFIFFLVIIYLELLSNGFGTIPINLSVLILVYLFINLLGTAIFSDWLKRGEAFNVYFNLLSNMSIFEKEDQKLFLRLPFSGLLSNPVKEASLVLFIILILSSTAFDGFRQSRQGYELDFYIFNLLSPLGISSANHTQAVLFVLIFGAFLILYLLSLTLMKHISLSPKPIKELFLEFSPSLLPIALAYNFAHYFYLLIVQIQIFIAQLSDPFSLGWNLFLTKDLSANPLLLNARAVWEIQVWSIILGHAVAIFIAHMIALKIFKDKRKATISQLPYVIIMIAYTVFGLWILSLPISFS